MKANKDAFSKYEASREAISSGKERAFSMGVGIHPERGPFILLTAPSDLVINHGKAVEWLIPLEDAKVLHEMLMKAVVGIAKHMINEFEMMEAGGKTPSKMAH